MNPSIRPEPRVPARLCDKQARALVDQHGPRLYRFVLRYVGNRADACDIVQGTLTDAVFAFDDFRGGSALAGWLYGIALNRVRNHLNRAPEHRYQFCAVDALAGHAAATPDPEAALDARQGAALLLDAIDALPPALRATVWHIAWEHHSYEETAAELAIPVGTVRSRLARARVRLRACLDSAGGG